jgi:hypothetical protein
MVSWSFLIMTSTKTHSLWRFSCQPVLEPKVEQTAVVEHIRYTDAQNVVMSAALR